MSEQKEICPLHDNLTNRIDKLYDRLMLILVVVLLNLIMNGADTMLLHFATKATAGG